jgi:hypothetical protein
VVKDNKYSRLSQVVFGANCCFYTNNLTPYMVSTLNVMAAIEFMGVSFGCNRRKTRKKLLPKKRLLKKSVKRKGRW